MNKRRQGLAITSGLAVVVYKQTEELRDVSIDIMMIKRQDMES